MHSCGAGHASIGIAIRGVSLAVLPNPLSIFNGNGGVGQTRKFIDTQASWIITLSRELHEY